MPAISLKEIPEAFAAKTGCSRPGGYGIKQGIGQSDDASSSDRRGQHYDERAATPRRRRHIPLPLLVSSRIPHVPAVSVRATPDADLALPGAAPHHSLRVPPQLYNPHAAYRDFPAYSIL